jgi:RNA polymerase sigma factor (sigma-70 family)
MNRQLSWEELVLRLEADLRLKEQLQEAAIPDDDAWEIAARLLRGRARILLSTHSGLQREDAEDIAQNVLVKLQSLHTMRRLRAAGSAQGYIVVMLRNAATDLVRSRLREHSIIGELGEELSEEAAVELPGGTLAEVQTLALAAALRSLSDEEKMLLKMRFEFGMSIREIAVQTRISYSAAAVRLFRILKRLRAQMT